MKKSFNISNHIENEEIRSIVKRLGNEKLTSTGHGFREHGSIPIIKAAILSTNNYTRESVKKPAIGLLSVILAANRNYNKVVEPNLIRIEKDYPELRTFQQLHDLLKSKSEIEFYKFWGHKDKKKYTTLKKLLSTILNDIQKVYPDVKDDFELMNCWGKNVDLLNYKNDIIGKIQNIAVATIQHLRMVYGVNTVKPDQRVKEVLEYEFRLSRLSNEKVIKTIEQIARIVEMEVITIDQIFVKYGSSCYNRNSSKLTSKQIAKNLKELKVDIGIISKATLLSQRQIESL